MLILVVCWDIRCKGRGCVWIIHFFLPFPAWWCRSFCLSVFPWRWLRNEKRDEQSSANTSIRRIVKWFLIEIEEMRCWRGTGNNSNACGRWGSIISQLTWDGKSVWRGEERVYTYSKTCQMGKSSCVKLHFVRSWLIWTCSSGRCAERGGPRRKCFRLVRMTEK